MTKHTCTTCRYCVRQTPRGSVVCAGQLPHETVPVYLPPTDHCPWWEAKNPIHPNN